MRGKPYPEEKRKILVERSNEEFISFLERIKGKKEKRILQSMLPNRVDGFRKGRVPLRLQVPLLILRLRKEISNPDSIKWKKFGDIFALWVNSQFFDVLNQFNNDADFDDGRNYITPPNSELDIECFRYLLEANHNNQIDQETIRLFYEFGYFLSSNEIEAIIDQALPRVEIEKRRRIEALPDHVEKLQQSVELLEEKLSAIDLSIETLKNQHSQQLVKLREEVEQKLTTVSQSLDSIVGTTSERLSKATVQFEQMIDLLKIQLSKTESKVEKIDRKQTNQLKLHEETEQGVTELSQHISDMKEEILEIFDSLTQSRSVSPTVDDTTLSDAPLISNQAIQIGNRYAELKNLSRYQSESEYLDEFHFYLRRLGVVDSSEVTTTRAIHVALKSFSVLELSDTRVLDAWKMACGNCLHLTTLDVELGWLGLSDWFPDLFAQECFDEKLERKDLAVSIKKMLQIGNMSWAIHLKNYDRSFPETYLPSFLDWLEELGNMSGITVFLTRCSGKNRCEMNEESYERIARLLLPRTPEPIKNQSFPASEYVVPSSDWASWCQATSDEHYQQQFEILALLRAEIENIGCGFNHSGTIIPLFIFRDIRRFLLLSYQIIEPTKSLDWALTLRLLPWIDKREEITSAIIDFIYPRDFELQNFLASLRGEL